MATWRDVDRVRKQFPDFGFQEIASAVGCNPAYVRATFTRRNWDRPKRKPCANALASITAYRDGVKLREIAQRGDTTISNVFRALKRWIPDEIGHRKRGRTARVA